MPSDIVVAIKDLALLCFKEEFPDFTIEKIDIMELVGDTTHSSVVEYHVKDVGVVMRTIGVTAPSMKDKPDKILSQRTIIEGYMKQGLSQQDAQEFYRKHAGKGSNGFIPPIDWTDKGVHRHTFTITK